MSASLARPGQVVADDRPGPGPGAGAARHRRPGLSAGPGRDRLRRRPGPGPGRARRPRRRRPASRPPAAGPSRPGPRSPTFPAGYLRLYCQAGARYRIPWSVLAAIGKVESDHGRVRLPGVRSGSNWAGACGPMQIGCVPGSKAGNSWARYGRGRPHDPAAGHPGRGPVSGRPRRPPQPRPGHLRLQPLPGLRGQGQAARPPLRPRRWAAMTAAELARRPPPGRRRSREELRLAQVASGLLLLLDAYRLTGRLPLEVQVQTSRLRHAVKLVIQAEAARTARPRAARRRRRRALDPAAAALRAWIAAQPWAQPGPVGWVYLLCFRDPTTGQHRPLQGNGCPGPVRRPLLGLDRRPHPPHQPRAPQPPLARGRPAGPGRPRGRADLRAGLAGVPGHPRPGAAAQEPGLGLSALPAVPRHRRPPRPGRRRRRHPAAPAEPS